jgi:hypothetical protein
MPDFEFTSPRGKTFTVTGPEGATPQQAWGILQSQAPGGDLELLGWDPHAEETTQLSRDVGSFGRAATQAAKDFPATPGKMAGALFSTGKGLWNTLTNFETYDKLKDPAWWKNIPSAVADEFSANWGDTERARKHFETDPTGFLSEVSIPLTGGAGLVRKGAELGVRGARAALPTIGSATSGATAADLRTAGVAGLKGGAEATEYKAGVASRPLTSEIRPAEADPLPADLDLPGIKASKAQEAQKALAAQREAEQAKLAPYGQAGQRLGEAGAAPSTIVIGGLAGGRLGTAAAATAASPRAMGSAMYGLGAAERGLSGARVPTRTMITAGAAELLKDREAKKELSDEDIKTLRKAKRGDADSQTMLAASRILSTAVKSPLGGSDVGAPRPAPEMTGETPLNLPGQSPGLGGAPAYGPSDAPKHGGKTLPEFVLQGMWDKLRTMPSRAGAAAWKAFEDPEHYDPSAPLEMAEAAMGRMPFAGRGQAGVGGGRLVQPSPFSKVKLERPLEEAGATYRPSAAPVASKHITPADLQGGLLLPAIGDRSLAGQQLTGMGGTHFGKPVELQGGPGYMPAHGERGAIWAAGKSIAPRIQNVTSKLAETGRDVYMPYTAMGERSVDFSHHVSDALTEMMRTSKISRNAAAQFDEVMKTAQGKIKAVKDWPGVKAKGLREYLASATGDVRNKFSKLMDTRKFQDMGFPSVAEARYAVTDPRLLHEPTGASGLEIARAMPGGGRPAAQHRTYEEAIPGKYVGGFGASIPKELMYPDIIGAFKKMGFKPVQFDYLMARTPKGAPIAQRATQQWVDNASKFLRSKGVALSGAALAALAKEIWQQNQDETSRP